MFDSHIEEQRIENQLSITYPQSLASTLKLGDRDFEREMKTISLRRMANNYMTVVRDFQRGAVV